MSEENKPCVYIIERRKNGHPYSAGSLQKIFDKALIKANIKNALDYLDI